MSQQCRCSGRIVISRVGWSLSRCPTTRLRCPRKLWWCSCHSTNCKATIVVKPHEGLHDRHSQVLRARSFPSNLRLRLPSQFLSFSLSTANGEGWLLRATFQIREECGLDIQAKKFRERNGIRGLNHQSLELSHTCGMLASQGTRNCNCTPVTTRIWGCQNIQTMVRRILHQNFWRMARILKWKLLDLKQIRSQQLGTRTLSPMQRP